MITEARLSQAKSGNIIRMNVDAVVRYAIVKLCEALGKER